jgi:hypothetical protein
MSRGGAGALEGSIYHVISRFVAKQWFVESAIERRMYLSLFGTALSHTNWRCFAFAIMSNHIHLGLLAGSASLRSWLQPMHTAFANWINWRRERIGAVFVRGPNVVAVRPDGGARLINYIHYNPVRAGVVEAPSYSDWTSHRAYLGQTPTPRWLDVELGVELAGFNDRSGFAEWLEGSRIDRAELDAARVVPRRVRGRPAQRFQIGQPGGDVMGAGS